MKHPFLVWLAFAACALTGFGVLGWFSREMLRYERAGDEIRRQAAIEENTRLALWRMDSALAGIHGLEAARPWQDYEPFFRAEGAFTPEFAPLPAGTVMLPSPLLGFTPPFVRLHFQIEPDGAIRSPQSPPGTLRSAAIAAGVTEARIDAGTIALIELRGRVANGELSALLDAPVSIVGAAKELRRNEVSRANTDEKKRDAREQDKDAPAAAAAPPQTEGYEQTVAPVLAEQQTPQPPSPLPAQQIAQTIQVGKSKIEQEQRQDLLVAQNEINVGNRSRRGISAAPRDGDAGGYAPGSAVADSATTGGAVAGLVPQAPPANAAPPVASVVFDEKRTAPASARIVDAVPKAAAAETRGEKGPEDSRQQIETPPTATEGPMQALWTGGELVFARRVSVGERTLVQGAWLDWGELRAWLLSRVTDLLPAARLEPALDGPSTLAVEATRRLAFIPAQLIPGPVAVVGDSSWSPLQISLTAAWGSATLGAVALALLLRGTLRLSERRGAFVSAVTHELRTPLTTFRMYTEMLAGDMVPDEKKRRSYLDTLRKEAERLSHLVENVLSYARLERGRASARIEDTTTAELLARIEERLRQRAQQGGLALRVVLADGEAEHALRTDTTAVEQILFNLVDNAAKYARRPDGAGEIVIDVTATTSGRARGIVVRVSDNGPGIAASVRKRLFQPFSKSATEAAHSQPGVGLGLALSRRLARDELHGDLVLERTGGEGTVFRLELPGG